MKRCDLFRFGLGALAGSAVLGAVVKDDEVVFICRCGAAEWQLDLLRDIATCRACGRIVEREALHREVVRP